MRLDSIRQYWQKTSSLSELSQRISDPHQRTNLTNYPKEQTSNDVFHVIHVRRAIAAKRARQSGILVLFLCPHSHRFIHNLGDFNET